MSQRTKRTYSGLVTVDYYRGADNVRVIHVDTPNHWPENKRGPICRIYLNDGEIFENPPLAGLKGEKR